MNATSWDAGAAVTCVGGDGCSMPAASAPAGFCHFVGSTARGRLGETPEQGRDAEQPQHNAQETHGQLPEAGNHLLRETSEIRVSHGWCLWGVSHWAAELAPAAWVWDAHLQNPWICAGGMGSFSQILWCGKNQHNFCSLSQQRCCFIFQILKTGKDVKLTAPKNTSPSPLSGRVFTSMTKLKELTPWAVGAAAPFAVFPAHPSAWIHCLGGNSRRGATLFLTQHPHAV